jgi:hypothetical protein
MANARLRTSRCGSVHSVSPGCGWRAPRKRMRALSRNTATGNGRSGHQTAQLAARQRLRPNHYRPSRFVAHQNRPLTKQPGADRC